MNLNAIVAPLAAAIMPREFVVITPSTGYAVNPDGSTVPGYAEPIRIQASVQSLQYNDIAQMDWMNIQGVRCAMYLDGDFEGIIRAAQKGGDLITRADGSQWLVAMVLERWLAPNGSGWVKAACTLQDQRTRADSTLITADDTLITADYT